MNPVWFLDVDGVINALSTVGEKHYEEFSCWEEVRVNGYRIRYAPELIEFINRMSERVDIHWLTTWDDNAVTMLAPALGLKEFKVAKATGLVLPFAGMNYLAQNRWWKWNAVIEHIENGGGDFIWTDDQNTATVRNATRKLADKEGLEHSIITPSKDTGLGRLDITRIENFVDTLEKYNAA